MRTRFENEVLLGALLERLGSVQSRSLLARLDRWLLQRDPDSPVESASANPNDSARSSPLAIDANR